MMEFVRKDLFDRIKSGTPHADDVRQAMQSCFDAADEALAIRRDIRFNPQISAGEKRRQLDELVDGPIAGRVNAIEDKFKPIKAEIVEARNKRWGSGYVPPEEAAAFDNLGLVDAAMYFARRDIRGQ